MDEGRRILTGECGEFFDHRPLKDYHLEFGDDVRDIEMILGSFQLACFDHEAELLELGKITQGRAVSDAGHFLRISR